MPRITTLPPRPPEHQARRSRVVLTNRELELPSIGWQLFILDSSQSHSTAFPSCLDTYATRLLTEPLSRKRAMNALESPNPATRSNGGLRELTLASLLNVLRFAFGAFSRRKREYGSMPSLSDRSSALFSELHKVSPYLAHMGMHLVPDSPGPSTSCPYSPKCVEGKFCELRHHVSKIRISSVLGNPHNPAPLPMGL